MSVIASPCRPYRQPTPNWPMGTLQEPDFEPIVRISRILDVVLDEACSKCLGGTSRELTPTQRHRLRDAISDHPFAVFTRAPPQGMSPLDFLISPLGQHMRRAVHLINELAGLEDIQRNAVLLDHFASVWPGLHRWIVFLFPLGSTLPYSDLLQRSNEPLRNVHNRVVCMLIQFGRWNYTSAQRQSIVQSEHGALSSALHVYTAFASGPQLPVDDRADGLPSLMVQDYVTMMALMLACAMNKEPLSDSAKRIICSAAGSRPHKVMRAAGWYLTFLNRSNLGAESKVTLVRQMQVINVFASIEVLRSGPRSHTLISALVHIAERDQTPNFVDARHNRNIAYRVLSCLCYNDPRTTYSALRSGIMQVLLGDQGLDDTFLPASLLLDCIGGSFLSGAARRKVAGEHIWAVATEPSRPLRLQQVCATWVSHEDFRQSLAHEWLRKARCCDSEVGGSWALPAPEGSERC
ncbi:hypothetical protein GGF50DRAFT_121563 [Schizophyllum commune]